MQDAVIDNVCECVQGFMVCYDEQLKELSASTQALSASLKGQDLDTTTPTRITFESETDLSARSTSNGFSNQDEHAAMAASWFSSWRNEQKTLQSFSDSLENSIQSLRSQADCHEQSLVPVINMDFKDVEALQGVADFIKTLRSQVDCLAEHVASPIIAEDNKCKDVLDEGGTSFVQPYCQEFPNEVRTSCSQQDVTDAGANDEPSDFQPQDGLADLLTKIMVLEHVKRNVAKPPWIAAADHQYRTLPANAA
jgi:hypothetical protein